MTERTNFNESRSRVIGGGNSQSVIERVIQLHDGSLVSAAVAVVWCTENGDRVALVGPVVALHDQLMGPGYEGQAIAVVKGLADILPECEAGTARGHAPAHPVIRVGPQQVAHGTLVRYLGREWICSQKNEAA